MRYTPVARDASTTKRSRPARASEPDARNRSRGGALPVAEGADLAVGPEDAALFAALKGLRGRIAKESKVPPYVVFPDRTLAELATRRPRTLASFGDIRGVGPAKLEKYAGQFLEVIRGSNDIEAA